MTLAHHQNADYYERQERKHVEQQRDVIDTVEHMGQALIMVLSYLLHPKRFNNQHDEHHSTRT